MTRTLERGTSGTGSGNQESYILLHDGSTGFYLKTSTPILALYAFLREKEAKKFANKSMETAFKAKKIMFLEPATRSTEQVRRIAEEAGLDGILLIVGQEQKFIELASL